MLYDVVVIGTGIAGLFAALEAKKSGQNVAVITKSNPFRSSSAVASGGINAVLYTGEDSVQQHIQDTIKGSDGLVNYKNVEQMCYGAKDVIYALEEIGVHFDKTEDGKIAQRPFGGTKHKRTCHVSDMTGSSIVQKLLLACRKEGVIIMSNYFFLNPVFYKNQISGLTLLRRSDSMVIAIAAKALILAGGGYAGIFRGHSTNQQENSGDTLAAALRSGMELRNMEFVQFHPTTFLKSGALITEAARGEGGYIVDENGKRFTNELLTRDRLARAIVQHIEKGHKVFLDLRHLDHEHIDKKLPSVKKTALLSAGIDIHKELIPISASAHYSMGGISAKYDTSTDMDGIFACGECASAGVHGANRLGGNSLLESGYFGQVAGKEAAHYAKRRDFLLIDYQQVSKEMEQIDRILNGTNLYNINTMRKNLGNALFYNAGLFRNEEKLTDALEYIHYLMKRMYGLHCVNKERHNNVELPAILEFQNALAIAEAMVVTAMQRKESRGVHYREDYPMRDDRHFDSASYVLQLQYNYMRVSFENVVQNSLWYNIKKKLGL